MTVGMVEKSERTALNKFDAWNDVTGAIGVSSSYYYEIQEVIKDAVHIGIQMALNGSVKFDKNGDVVRGDNFGK